MTKKRPLTHIRKSGQSCSRIRKLNSCRIRIRDRYYYPRLDQIDSKESNISLSFLKPSESGGVNRLNFFNAYIVKPKDGYYWDTQHGKMTAFTRKITGAISGETIDDSIQGGLKT